MRIEEPGPTIKELDVVRFETNLGTRLPVDYRSFLLSHNGGYPVPDAFRFEDGRPGSSIHYFFQVTGKERTYRLDYAIETFQSRVPGGFLPIARDPGGNLILLCIKGAEEGSVWFWDHELESDVGEPATRANLTMIAKTFDALLSGLYDAST